jgi:hypothetical protein
MLVILFWIGTKMARPKRFELLTPRFVVWCSIQLSYGRPGLRGAGGAEWRPAENRVPSANGDVAKAGHS